MKVLIVDDAEIDSLLCQKIVESLGYRPIVVSSADEAREILLKPGSPDIVCGLGDARYQRAGIVQDHPRE